MKRSFWPTWSQSLLSEEEDHRKRGKFSEGVEEPAASVGEGNPSVQIASSLPSSTNQTTEQSTDLSVTTAPKRKRGRPPKNKPITTADELGNGAPSTSTDTGPPAIDVDQATRSAVDAHVMNDTHENAPPPTAEEGGGTGDDGFPAAGGKAVKPLPSVRLG